MLNKLNNTFDTVANSINNNKYFYGLMMIMLNVGSKYLTLDLSAPFLKAILSSTFIRRLLGNGKSLF